MPTADGRVTKIVPRVIVEDFTNDDYIALLSSPAEQDQAATAISTTCKDYGFDGVVLEVWSRLQVTPDVSRDSDSLCESAQLSPRLCIVHCLPGRDEQGQQATWRQQHAQPSQRQTRTHLNRAPARAVFLPLSLPPHRAMIYTVQVRNALSDVVVAIASMLHKQKNELILVIPPFVESFGRADFERLAPIVDYFSLNS